MLSKKNVHRALMSAIRNGNLKTVRDIVNCFGLSYSPEWLNGYMLLLEAIQHHHIEIAKLLLTKGCRVKITIAKPSTTLLHTVIIETGDAELVAMLLERGVNVNARRGDGNTPLHDAVDTENVEIAKLLLNKNANVNAKDDKGYIPLHYAVKLGKEEMVKVLVTKKECVNTLTTNGKAPLHFATQKGYVHIAEILLNHGASVNAICSSRWRNKYTPLHFACEQGSEEVGELLINRGADVNAKAMKNLTPLHVATKKGHRRVARLLLQNGAKTNIQDADGKTTLYVAVEKKHLMIIGDILKFSPAKNKKNIKMAFNAVASGNKREYKKILKALLQYDFAVDPEDAYNCELLHVAIEKGHLRTVEDLLKYGADLRVAHNLTLLHTCVDNNQFAMVKLLLNYGADVNAIDENLKTPIFYAIENGNLLLTKLLLAYGAKVKEYPRLLYTAVENECPEIVQLLLQFDVDVNATDEYGRAALHFIAPNEYGALSEFRPDYVVNENNDDRVKKQIVLMLLKRGANVNAKAKNGATILHVAIEKEYVNVVETLLEYNADVNSLIQSEVITPLHISAYRGNEVISRMLLKKGANVNFKHSDEITALHVAAQKGHEKVVELLLENGAEHDARTKGGITPLYIAAQRGRLGVVKILLRVGADVNVRDNYGRTALHTASKEGHINVVNLLLEYGTDVNTASDSNHMPIEYAMFGIRSFSSISYNRYSYNSDYYYYHRRCECYDDIEHITCPCEKIIEILTQHVVKLKLAGLFVNEKNSLFAKNAAEGLKTFKVQCEAELKIMRGQKLPNCNVGLHDIVSTNNLNKLVIFARNVNVMQALKSDDYETRFPLYGVLVKSQIRKGLERKELLRLGFKYFRHLFEALPDLVIDMILAYLDNTDLRALISIGKTLNIPNFGTIQIESFE